MLAGSLRTWVAERGYRWNTNDGEAFERAMQTWQPFPDTIPSLTRAQKAGIRLVILSNTDRHIMEHTLRHLEPVTFDAVIVAEDVRSYKPDPRNFAKALAASQARPEEILHVAFGFKYDIGPAQEAGMATAWVNRHGAPRPGEEQPDHEWRNLWALAELAEGQQAA